MPPLDRLDVTAYTIPTDAPESDGTFAWDSTTIVVVEAHGGGQVGTGYSYTHGVVAPLIRQALAPCVLGRSAMDVEGCWWAMVGQLRNVGRTGLGSSAVAAVDVALWDLKARLLALPMVQLLGGVRDRVMAYGSGGFTSYDDRQLREQLGGWAAAGLRAVKMKVGRVPADDPARVRAARAAIGPNVELFVDANGAFSRKQALGFGALVAEASGVTWFEEPVSSDDLMGLRLIRDRAPAGMAIAAGEYGYDASYFRHMLDAGAVDVLQADATRCGGITGLLQVGALCTARSMPLSAHTSPTLHAHPACAIHAMRHVEYFHDHARVERLIFDGALEPAGGDLVPDSSRPGLGIELRRPDASRYEIRV